MQLYFFLCISSEKPSSYFIHEGVIKLGAWFTICNEFVCCQATAKVKLLNFNYFIKRKVTYFSYMELNTISFINWFNNSMDSTYYVEDNGIIYTHDFKCWYVNLYFLLKCLAETPSPCLMPWEIASTIQKLFFNHLDVLKYHWEHWGEGTKTSFRHLKEHCLGGNRKWPS